MMPTSTSDGAKRHWRDRKRGVAESLAGTYADFFGTLLPLPRASRPVPAEAPLSPPFPRSKSQHVRPFVTCRWLGRSGRLGNQLFQVAATIGTARKNGLDFVFPPWHYAGYFQRVIPQSADIPEAEVYAEPSFAYRDIRVCRPTDLAGCFQSERYFKHCEDEIRGYFAPRVEVLAALHERFGELLSQPTCSVHVRRGDYVHYPQYVDLAATDYYEKAIEQVSGEHDVRLLLGRHYLVPGPLPRPAVRVRERAIQP